MFSFFIFLFILIYQILNFLASKTPLITVLGTEVILDKYSMMLTTTTTTTTSLFLTLNIQMSHHLQIARLIEAGGV